MNFTPFYYHIQELIVQDDDQAIKEIWADPLKKEEFKSYGEDFMHCTYPNSFKCLYFLMNEINLRYNIHSVLSDAMQDNNVEWFEFFFKNFSHIIANITDKQSISSQIINKNIFTMSLSVNHQELLQSSLEIWDIVFKYPQCKIFSIIKLVDEIFYKKDYFKLFLVEKLSQKHNLDLSLKEIISKAFFANKLDIVDYFFSKYLPKFDNNELNDLANTVGLTSNVAIFNYFTQHFLPFKNFTNKQISLVFNTGILIGKTALTQHLKELYDIDFYPLDKFLKSEFIANRRTIWEDNNDNSLTSLSLLTNVNNLFNLFSWNKNELTKELSSYDEISLLFSKVQLNNRLHNNLKQKKLSNSKNKI